MTVSNFGELLLEPEQRDLLIQIVEAVRSLPREKREKLAWSDSSSSSLLHHPGFPAKNISVYSGDLEALTDKDLLRRTGGSTSSAMFDVTPEGFAYYAYLKQESDRPIEQIQSEVRNYLDAEAFQKSHPESSKKFAEAERILWSSDSSEQLTTIGHICREAVQQFATELVEREKPPDADPEIQHTVARLQQVLAHAGGGSSEILSAHWEALISYWGTLNDLIQRQEHGAQKEGDELMWEDARRLVFQTAVVMFEIEHALLRSR